MSEEESGLPKHLENPVGMSATAALVWKGTDLAKPTENQTPPLMAKNLTPLSMLSAYLARPKGGERTNPLQPLWLGGHPSVGGGTAPRGHWTEGDRMWFECA
jgi:hypothetical protein